MQNDKNILHMKNSQQQHSNESDENGSDSSQELFTNEKNQMH